MPFVAAAAPARRSCRWRSARTRAAATVEALAEAIDASIGLGHSSFRPDVPSSIRAAGDPAPRAAGNVLVVAAVGLRSRSRAGADGRQRPRRAAALAALDLEAVGRWDDAFADGRGALRLAMTLARRAGAARWTTLAVTDSRSLPDWAGGEVTGYVAGCWGR
ncbi:MAG: hypothetical protein U0470_00545 [Anaerolineae bacterium]